MSDSVNSTAGGPRADTPTPLPDWTDHGAYRAAFLEVFEPADRPALRKAGAILASQVMSGDPHKEPAVVSELEAAYDDARMLADYLLEIWNRGEGTFATARQHRLADRCRVWAGEVASIALAIRGALDDREPDGRAGGGE